MGLRVCIARRKVDLSEQESMAGDLGLKIYLEVGIYL